MPEDYELPPTLMRCQVEAERSRGAGCWDIAECSSPRRVPPEDGGGEEGSPDRLRNSRQRPGIRLQQQAG